MMIGITCFLLGIVAAVGLNYLFYKMNIAGFMVSYHKEYRDIELISYSLQGSEIRVRCRNTGKKKADFPSFKLKIISSGHVINEYVLYGRDPIPAGQIVDEVLTLNDPVSGVSIDLKDKEFDLEFDAATV